MARQYCLFCSNRTASQLIALVEIIFCILTLLGAIFTVVLHPFAGILAFISAGIGLIAAICLFVGARRGIPSFVMVWVVLALVNLVLYAINVYNYSTEKEHNFQWIGYVIGIVLRVWFLLVAIGAREEISGEGPTGYVV